MNLDEELRTILVSESERREPPSMDAQGTLARGKARWRRPTMLQVGAAASMVAVIGVGAFGFTRADHTTTLSAIAPTSTVPQNHPRPRPYGTGAVSGAVASKSAPTGSSWASATAGSGS